MMFCPRSSYEEPGILMHRFAEKHRRLLNTLLRSNASLLQGSLAPLLKLPRLIEFDNKRSYFRTRIHATSDDHRRYGGLRIAVRRSHVFEDSFHQMRMRYVSCLLLASRYAAVSNSGQSNSHSPDCCHVASASRSSTLSLPDNRGYAHCCSQDGTVP